MKFAFIPHNRYDAPTSRGLANALRALGHEASILPPHRLHLPNLNATFTREQTLYGFDIIIEVNTARDETIPKSAVHIAWIQDFGKGDPNRDYDRVPMADFVFVNRNLLDHRVGSALCSSLREFGHTAECIDRQNIKTPDFVIEPCGTRDDAIPKDTVHIPWVYEYYGAGDPPYENALGHDLIYTLGDPDILGCPRFPQWRGSLTMAVDETLLQRPAVEPTLDFSIAGFIPPPHWFTGPTHVPAAFKPGLFNVTGELANLVREANFKPLSGTFDQLEQFAQFKDRLYKFMEQNNWASNDFGFKEMHKYGAKLTHEWARLLNRRTVADLVLSLSDNVEFMGGNWDQWPNFAPYSRPFTGTTETLLNLYQHSRINVHDNIYGFAMHSRVLEAMAVGGFIMANESPHFGKAGQMTETFEPGVHFGQYNAQTFVPEAQYWLKTDRRKAVENARKVVSDKHLWKHRAQQILNDLGL